MSELTREYLSLWTMIIISFNEYNAEGPYNFNRAFEYAKITNEIIFVRPIINSS